MPPFRRLVLHLAYELGSGRALDNAVREVEELDRIYETIDALAVRVAPAPTEMQHVA